MELFDPERFELMFNGVLVDVKEHNIGAQQVFRIEFSDKRDALVITKASTAKGKCWMSIPQGRLQEAEELGDLISNYFKGKK